MRDTCRSVEAGQVKLRHTDTRLRIPADDVQRIVEWALLADGIGPIAEVSEVGVLVEGPAVSGSVVVDLAVTRSALGASCRSEGRWARSRVRGKRVDGRVCSVTVAAVRLKEVWLCDPEGIRRPEPHPGVHLHAVKGKLSCIGLSIKYHNHTITIH